MDDDPNSMSKCHYTPEGAGKVGISEGCLIGRAVPKAIAIIMEEYGSSVYTKTQFLNLPESMRNMGQEFLETCQCLHDFGDRWEKIGLSERGKEHLEEIISEFELSQSSFQDYLN